MKKDTDGRQNTIKQSDADDDRPTYRRAEKQQDAIKAHTLFQFYHIHTLTLYWHTLDHLFL